jgi:hypothetical protein
MVQNKKVKIGLRQSFFKTMTDSEHLECHSASTVAAIYAKHPQTDMTNRGPQTDPTDCHLPHSRVATSCLGMVNVNYYHDPTEIARDSCKCRASVWLQI